MARPTVYREEMPNEMLDMMSNGAKDSWIYARWNISKETFYTWLKEKPELKEAHEKGLALCEVWWEQKGMELMSNQDNKAFNYWIAFMNRKFGWNKNSDSQTNINIQNMNVLNTQTRDERLEFIKNKLQELDIIDVTPQVTDESDQSE